MGQGCSEMRWLCVLLVVAAAATVSLAGQLQEVETMDGGELEGLREADMFEVSDPAEEREIHEEVEREAEGEAVRAFAESEKHALRDEEEHALKEVGEDGEKD